MFDFLKRKELARIDSLEKEIEALKSSNSEYSRANSILEGKVKELERYSEIADINEAINDKRIELSRAEKDLESFLAKSSDDISRIEEKRSEKELELNNLSKDIALYKEEIGLADFGLYSPHFDYDTSEKYKEAITRVRSKQKEHISNGTAVVGGESISWGNSLSQGQAMIGRIKKLMLRAFNGESDYLISCVDWSNISKYEERIKKSFESINKTLDKQGVHIAYIYLELKLEELRLTHEYQVKKQEEREEQRAIREQMREEERAIREMEQAKAKAEKEERMYIQALEKARREMGEAVGEKQAELLARIAELESGLAGVEVQKQKAISMAQQTKMGYVYIISNIGSFGEEVFKIGMTRRLDPMDRVRELGDASVPFSFDVHGMIFSENAPDLEYQLHKAFSRNRINLINDRKEFFRVPLLEIKQEAEKLGAKFEMTMLAEAAEYRESERLRSLKSNGYQVCDTLTPVATL